MSPYGGLMMCEDGLGEQHILGTTEDGEVFKFARNRVNNGTPEDPEYGELAGAGFSADGRTMFFNVYTPGHHVRHHRPVAPPPLSTFVYE